MLILVRAAMPQDAQTIAEIIRLAFHEEANSEQIQRLIDSESHHSYVAASDKVVGFVDGFSTLAPDGKKRLELDLIAVHPDFSGQGIGKQLIQVFSENVLNVDMIRALVAVNNNPMHRAMKATGYQLNPQVHALYIASCAGEKVENPPKIHLIPVETFTYCGIWLEGEISTEAILAAQYQCQKLAYDIVGAVVPTENAQAVETLNDANFEYIKDFQWWTRNQG